MSIEAEILAAWPSSTPGPINPSTFEAEARKLLSRICPDDFRPAQFKVTKIKPDPVQVEWEYAMQTFIPIRIRPGTAFALNEALRKVVSAVATRIKMKNNNEIKNLFY